MTLDRPPTARNAQNPAVNSAPRLPDRRPQTPSSVRSPLYTAPPALRTDGQPGRVNAKPMGKDADGETPVKAFMTSNVTPRSGSRKARVESASTTPRRTPEHTPPTARPFSMIEGRDWPSGGPKIGSGLGNRGGHLARPARAQSVVGHVQYPVQLALTSRNEKSATTSPETLPKFFHASEAKPSRGTTPRSQPPRLQPRVVGSGHVNELGTAGTASLSASPGAGDDRPKLLFANGTQPNSPPATRPVNNSCSARPPLQTIFSSYQTPSSPAQRPPSPLKEEVLPISRKSSLSKPSRRRHTRLVSSGSNDIRAPDTVLKGHSDISRRASLSNPAKHISQPQSPTTSTFGRTPSRRSSIALSESGRESALMMSPEPTGVEHPSTEPKDMSSPEQISSPSQPAPGQSKLDHLNELAANARRERKVLDLEISNSSLLAINRTLEAEMRKQKAELRHLRRLRSSSHFAPSTRSASSRFSMPSTNDDLSPTSSTDEDGVDDDRFSNLSSGISDDTSFPDSLSFSPTMRNSSIPAAKGRQSRSFKIDLSAQRLLLLDGQKLNQALKRCLSRTDELISEGKNALEYRVNTGGTGFLGLRVLTPDDRDLEVGLGQGLLSPGLDEKMENPLERARSVGEMWKTPQRGGQEGLMLDMPTHVNQDEPSENKEIWSVERDILEWGHQSSVDDMPAEPLRAKSPLPSPAGIRPTYDGPRSPSRLGIPYEDPGIDTGSETPSAEIITAKEPYPLSQQQQSQTTEFAPPTDLPSRSSSPDAEAEPTIASSPGKGLGDLFRMVGGSWGV
ncbi:MAG: hypothetical protein L6R35_004231 [Caloplaca aegaea]|nr:MAG: hypothetical protein L6R35_004231 [Caloplaca aegaea]